MDINTFRGLVTGLFLVAFLAIVAYAWSARHRGRFEEIGRSILDEPDNPAAPTSHSRNRDAGSPTERTPHHG